MRIEHAQHVKTVLCALSILSHQFLRETCEVRDVLRFCVGEMKKLRLGDIVLLDSQAHDHNSQICLQCDPGWSVCRTALVCASCHALLPTACLLYGKPTMFLAFKSKGETHRL